MIEGLPVMDAHLHLDPRGTPVQAVNRFVQAGGTHLLIIHKPYHHIREDSIEGFKESYATTISMCDLANENGVKAWCVAGPYPGALPHLAKSIGLNRAKELHFEAMDMAFRLVDQGSAIGIGEVGRVHFPVDEEVQKACDEVLAMAMRGARKRSCPVILHTEAYTQNGSLFNHLAKIADSCGLSRTGLIKHYAGWEEAVPDVGKGISVSMQARRRNLEKALEMDLEFLMETDYIDENDRPDVVMPPDTVPKKISWAYRKGIIDREKHEELMIDLPEKILGVNIQ